MASECIRVIGTFEGASGGSTNCVIPVDEDQQADETIVVIAAQVSLDKTTNQMRSMNGCSDSQGNTYHVGTSASFNLGAIRANLGGGSDNDGMQLGTSAVMNDTTSPVLLQAGDTVTAQFGTAGETPDGYCAVVLAIGLRAGNNPGVVPRSSEVGFPSSLNYQGLSTTQGNPTLDWTAEAWQATVEFPGSMPAGIVEAFALCAAASMGGEVTPSSADAEEVVTLDYAGQLHVQVWAILGLVDGQEFDPGASAISGDANVLTWQLGTTTAAPGSPGPCATPSEIIRFGESGPWRFLVTDLESVTQALLDRLATNREIVFTLNEACQMSGSVPSDTPEINLEGDSGDPLLAEWTRLLYCFRRERDEPSSDGPIWVIRAAGIILSVDDQGGPDVPVTDFIAYDPWALLYRRPLRDEEGNLPPEGGLVFSAAGSAIAEQIIAFSELVDGTTHLDLLTGTIETTPVVDITFQQGISVGEALDQLVDTGTMDVIMEPIYDPIDKPGTVCVLNIFETAGDIRRAAIFAWDKPGRNLVDLNRQTSGRDRANKLQYYVGQGGPPVPLITDATSVAKYGRYWEQQFFPANENADVVEGFANTQRRLRRNGLITYQISPAPERALTPITDYYIGDYVPIYATSRLREEVATLKRVYSIPLVIGDDQMEAPAGVIVADDETPEDS